MALPRVVTPTFELTIPSTGEKVSYRPFLVKEEKILLMAIEDGSVAAMSKAMNNIISDCTEGKIKIKDLAPFDIEYFFLQLRGKSVGDTVDLTLRKPRNLTCGEKLEDCTAKCEIQIDINDINVDSSEVKDSKIELTDTIGVKLNYPQFEIIQKFTGIEEDTSPEHIFELINECIEYIWDGEEIYKAKDSTKKEINEFVESLSSVQFQKIRGFFDGMPKLKHDIMWKCPKCDKEAPMVLEGIDAFFE
jgi:hypothetical protein